MDPRTAMLLEAPVGPTILRLALPNVVVMVVQASIGLIETYFVAKLGLDALAGMALVFPLFMLLQMVSAGAMGGGSLSAIARSSGHRPSRAVRERRAIFRLALSSIADQHAAFHRQRQRVARFVIAQTHSDFIDKSCLSIGRNLRQLFARYFRTAFEKNLDKRPRRWVSRLQRYDRGRYRDESRLRNKLQKLSFIRKRPCHRSRSIGAYGRFQSLK
jgi:hypothetical protein